MSSTISLPIRPDHHGRCPACGVSARFVESRAIILVPSGGTLVDNHPVMTIDIRGAQLTLYLARCPDCHQQIVTLEEGGVPRLIVPRSAFRPALHPAVPKELRDDYEEAADILSLSPKSSAALSRRCLQSLLVLQEAKSRDLFDQLAEVYEGLPSYVQPFVDNIRGLGNISAHAKTSISTGEIVEVEPGEAEWMLEILEELFDHYYVKPAEAAARHAALQAKLADAGKLAVVRELQPAAPEEAPAVVD